MSIATLITREWSGDERIQKERRKLPNGQAEIDPAAVFVPASFGNGVQAQQNICYADFHIFPASDEGSASGKLGVMHQLGV